MQQKTLNISLLLLTLMFLMSSLVLGAQDTKNDSSSLLSPAFYTSFNTHSLNIKNQSGVTLDLVVGSSREVTTSSFQTVTILLSADTVLFFSSPDMDIMGEMQEKILTNECDNLIQQKRYQEVVELLFVNYVELIAHNKNLSFSELLEIPQENSEDIFSFLMVKRGVGLLIFVLLAYGLYRYTGINRPHHSSSTPAKGTLFGGSLWK